MIVVVRKIVVWPMIWIAIKIILNMPWLSSLDDTCFLWKLLCMWVLISTRIIIPLHGRGNSIDIYPLSMNILSKSIQFQSEQVHYLGVLCSFHRACTTRCPSIVIWGQLLEKCLSLMNMCFLKISSSCHIQTQPNIRIQSSIESTQNHPLLITMMWTFSQQCLVSFPCLIQAFTWLCFENKNNCSHLLCLVIWIIFGQKLGRKIILSS